MNALPFSPNDPFDNLPIGVVLATVDYKVIYANREFLSIIEWTEEDLAEQSLTSIVSTFFPASGAKKLIDLFDAEDRWHNTENCITRKDGSNAWVRILLTSVNSGGGETCLQLLIEDVTKYRELIDSLLSRQRLYRSIVEKQPDPICRFLPDWSLVFANSSFRKRFDRNHGDILGAHFLELIPSGDRWMFESAVQSIDQDNPIVEVEHLMAGEGNRPLWTRWVIQGVLYKTGHIKDYQAVGMDVTDQKIAEDRVIHADRLVSLGTLVSGVAHEINNPNNFISLNAPLLLELWDRTVRVLRERTCGGKDVEISGLPLSEVAEHVPQLVRGIVEGSDRIRDIIEELKEFGRRDEHEFEPLAVNDIVGSAVFLMDKAIQTHTRRFAIRSGNTLPLVRGRRRRLEQVVVNLIQNACDALRNDEEAIEIETFFDEPTGTIRITVRDEGVGIRSEDLPRITDPFFTTRRSAGGTGLGLSISLGIVKEHGGRLFFESSPNRGTTAVVVLPASRLD